MTGLDIYTADYEPRRVYGDESDSEHDPTPVERAVRFGDAPLALLVAFDDGDGHVVWSFRGKRRSETNRTEYYVADYRSERAAVFRSLATELEAARDDGWIVPHADDLRWDLGFDLWRVPADVPDLSPDEREDLFDRLEEDESDPVVFGMTGFRSALATVRAMQEAEIDCTVAVGTEGDAESLDADLLLVPDADADFEPRSSGAEQLLESAESQRAPPDPEPSPTGLPDRDGTELGFASRIASAALLVVLAFSGYSFVASTPVHPITGLSTLGGLVGSIGVFVAFGDRMTPDGMGPWDGLAPDAGPRARLLADQGWTLRVVAYGTICAFLFPTTFRVGGQLLTPGPWLFGPISVLGSAALQVPLFVAGLYALSVSLLSVASRRSGLGGLTTETLRDLAVVHFLYGFSVLLATGLAEALWFRVIPSITM